MVEYPVIIECIFPSWTITRRCKNEKDLEDLLDLSNLELVSSVQVGEYLCCIAKSHDVQKVERII